MRRLPARPPTHLPERAKGAQAVTLLGVLAVHLEHKRRSIEAADGSCTQTQGVLDLNTVVDLTPRVAEGGGTIEFTAPDDVDVELFAFYIHGTGQTADPSFSVNDPINYFDPAGAEALTDYRDRKRAD